MGESHAGGTLGGWAVTNTYNADLRRTRLRATLGGVAQVTQDYGYDAAGRLQSASSGSFSAEYGYLANSPLVGTVSHRYHGHNRLVTTKQYDFINRLSSIGNGAGAGMACGRDGTVRSQHPGQSQLSIVRTDPFTDPFTVTFRPLP